MTSILLVLVVLFGAVALYGLGRRYGVPQAGAGALAGVGAVIGVLCTVIALQPVETVPATATAVGQAPTAGPATGVPTTIPLAEAKTLSAASSPAGGGVDKVTIFPLNAGTYDAGTRALKIKQGGRAILEGWSFDNSANTVGAGITALVDRHVVATGLYGLDRGDVAAYFKLNQIRFSGFRVPVTSAGIVPGKHTIAIGLIKRGSTSYELLPNSIDLTVTR